MLIAERPAAPPFAGLAAQQAIVLAVSGGSDSTALLHLAREHFSHHHPECRLVAVTVDHGLRAQSAAEADSVAALCAALDVPHRIVRWTGPKPATGIAAAARDARYRLLAEAARAVGAALILTGHTADDQAETVAMRRQRGDGPGLAGMAPAVLVEGDVWVVRPLLDRRRQALRDLLRDAGHGWIDDPSNADRRAERVRIRQGLKEPDMPMLLAQARHWSGVRRRISAEAGALIRDDARQDTPGLFSVGTSALRDAAPEVAVASLRLLIATVGGTVQPPPLDRAEALVAELLAAPLHRATLGRCLVAERRGLVWIARESRGLPGLEEPMNGAIWDGRFRFEETSPAAVTDREATHGGESAQLADAPAALLGAARLAQPPEAPGTWTLRPCVAPYAGFLPLFDLPVARALAALVGAPAVPDPPWPGHNGTEA